MAIPLLMPSLSPTMEEGSISEWKVKVGDKITEGMVLCVVETDKTAVEYESPDDGYLREIIVPNDKTILVNQLIAILTDTTDEGYADELKEAKAESEKVETASPSTNGSEDISEPLTAPEEIPATPGEPIIESPVVTPVPVQTPPVAPQPITAATPASSGARIMATPIAKNVAAANGVDLSQVPSSGPNGRIVKADVENFVKNGAGAVKATPKPVDLPISYGSMAPVTETVDVALNPTMKIVAARLLESHLGAPFFFVTLKIETDALIAFRAQLNNTPGYKISVNDLIIKAVASNLRAFPRVNAAFHGDKIRQHGNIDISIAVALEDGLITPIVKNADQKALGQISSEVKQLAQKAQSGTLLPEEYQGGTFTISNMGMYGVSEFTAILNPPQAGILAVGGTQTELYKTGSGDIEERNYMNVTLTSDHRVINGALAAQFLQGLKVILENPVSMVI